MEMDIKWNATEILILLDVMLFYWESELSPQGSNKKHSKQGGQSSVLFFVISKKKE